MGRKSKIAPGTGERIAAFMQPGETQALFATSLGFSEKTLGNYLRGDREPSYEFLARLREKRGADINAIFSADPPQSALRSNDHMIQLPRYDIQASAGPGSLVLNEDIADFMTVSREWLARYVQPNGRIGIVEARGDSMHPTIRDGDVLIVTRDIDEETVAGGGIFLVSVEGALMVKRLHRRLDGTMVVISDNDHYENETIPAGELIHKLTVHARVFWAGGPL